MQGRQNLKHKPVVFKISRLDRLLLALNSFGYIILPLIWMTTDWFKFADYRLAPVFSAIGFVLYALAIFIIIKAQIQLNHSWSPWLEVFAGHKFVGQGMFKHIRHPIYAAHFLWAAAMPLIMHNWLAGFALLATFLPFYFYRIGREEKMLLEYFGESYLEYMQRTERIVPRW